VSVRARARAHAPFVKRNGCDVQAPKKPLALVRACPTVCAPMSATVSTSSSPMRANLARTAAGEKLVAALGAVGSAVGTPPAKPSDVASGSCAAAGGADAQGKSTRPARQGMAGPFSAVTARAPARVNTSPLDTPG
jgi:hypothetical protein